MNRVVAVLPESVEELCLVKLGLMVRKIRALPFAIGIGRAIARAAGEATKAGAGLLRSEGLLADQRHFVILQYWASFGQLEAWSHRPPHSDWWKLAVERMRTKGDFGIYHETYLVPRAGVESIYLNCPPTGLASFGTSGEAVGKMTTSRDRLGRRAEQG